MHRIRRYRNFRYISGLWTKANFEAVIQSLGSCRCRRCNISGIAERWEKGIPHNPKSEDLVHKIADLDFENGDVFCFKLGGDGDNGEHLMYLLDMIFEEECQSEQTHVV